LAAGGGVGVGRIEPVAELFIAAEFEVETDFFVEVGVEAAAEDEHAEAAGEFEEFVHRVL
jgi:hypothetical protein